MSRRQFLKHTAAAGLLAATSVPGIGAAADARIAEKASTRKAAHKSGARIKSVVRREETVLRHTGSGDNWHMSWAADDRQYVSLCDGFGFAESPKGFYNSRLLAVSGGPQEARFSDFPAYPDLIPMIYGENTAPRYYSFGTLALDGRIYQYLSTFNHPFVRNDGSIWSDLRFVGAKLICSPDNGRTWCNQDGSTPVVWEAWGQRSKETLAFFEEDQDAFSLLTVLQMGRNYEHNRDGFVYVYAPNGNTEGTMNELVMFRVPKAQILIRAAYEYFAGRRGRTALWTKDIEARSVVHTFPRGWVNVSEHPYAWQPSVVYNAPLGLYMMTTWGTGFGPDGMFFGKPSYLGFWIAPEPWGPWTQIHEETAWLPAGDRAARAYQPQIAPKWIAPDGKSFWLVWTDFQMGANPQYERMKAEIKEKMVRGEAITHDMEMNLTTQMFRTMPNYSFNRQRVDLVL